MSDRIAVECSHCHTRYALPGQFLGKKATCKKCGNKFVANPIAESKSLADRSGLVTASAVQRTPAATPVPAPRPKPPAPAAPNPLDDSGVPAGASLDDTILAWLNAAPDIPDDAEDIPIPKPRVVTFSEVVGPNEAAAKTAVH